MEAAAMNESLNGEAWAALIEAAARSAWERSRRAHPRRAPWSDIDEMTRRDVLTDAEEDLAAAFEATLQSECVTCGGRGYVRRDVDGRRNCRVACSDCPPARWAWVDAAIANRRMEQVGWARPNQNDAQSVILSDEPYNPKLPWQPVYRIPSPSTRRADMGRRGDVMK